jgi:hypothetical protein
MNQQLAGIEAQKRGKVRTPSRRRAACVALALLSVFCGAQAAQSQLPDPKRFEADIQKFEAQDAIQKPPEGAIVLTGSSSIRRWHDHAAAALAPLTVIPRGFGSSYTHDLLHYIDRVAIAYKPRAIVVYEGDNDTGGRPPVPRESIVGDMQKIVARIHDKLPGSTSFPSSPASRARPAGRWRRK